MVYGLLQLMESLVLVHFISLHENREEEVICDICRKANALKTCLTCNASYCEPDFRQHYTVEALQRHTFIDVKGKCCQHYQKPLDFLCRTDQMQICSICAKGNHRSHDIISLRAHTPSQVNIKYVNNGKVYCLLTVMCLLFA